MRRAPAVSRPAWMMTLSGGSGGQRRSPVEAIANAASYVTRSPAADVSGLRTGWLGRWTDGVAALRGDCVTFASHWQTHNHRILTETGPLWVVLGVIPDGTVVLDLPLPSRLWGILGRISVPYVTRINRIIHEMAGARDLPVAEISAHFMPPWDGKFASDSFHPSQAGYRDWARALLTAIPWALGSPARSWAAGAVSPA